MKKITIILLLINSILLISQTSKPTILLDSTKWGIEGAKINTLSKGIHDITFNGKKILWVGTSITWGCTYAANASTAVGATYTNVGQASSPVRAGKTDSSYTDLEYQHYVFALSHTTAEQQYILDNWATIRTSLAGSPPETFNVSQQNTILQSSYEYKIIPNIATHDIIVIEHGYNDVGTTEDYGDDSATFTTFPTPYNNRYTYIGAMNYVIEKILEEDPKKRIFLLGHYENKHFPQIAVAQQIVADYWNIPILQLWKVTGWTNVVIDGKTMKNNWLTDGVHPYSDLSGDSDAMLDKYITDFLMHNF